MIQIAAIIRETFYEAISNKILTVFLGLALIAIVLIVITINTPGVTADIESLRPTAESPGEAAMLAFIHKWEFRIAAFFYPAMLLIATFITASIIPNTLQKGIIDVYLSKPVRRSTLLFGKSLGGLLIVVFCIVVFVLSVWLIIAIKTGYWTSGLLLSMIPIIVSFASIYAILILTGLLSQSSAVSMIVAYVIAIIVGTLLYSRETLLFNYIDSETIQSFITGLYYLMPQTQDMSDISTALIQGNRIPSFWPMYQAIALTAVLFGVSGWVFKRKEF